MPIKQQVFISYSREPASSHFARELAKSIRQVGFDTWLDVEHIPGGARFEKDIQDAIENSHHCLFLVTRRWLTQDYTLAEMKWFCARRDPSIRMIAIICEDLQSQQLPAQLLGLNHIFWGVDESEPDARFWQVYCGLTGTRPGPQERWAEKGRDLFTGQRDSGQYDAGQRDSGQRDSGQRQVPESSQGRESPTRQRTPAQPGRPASQHESGEVPAPAADVATRADGDWMRCENRPVAALPSRAGVVVITENGDCLAALEPASGSPWKAPDIHSFSAAAATAEGALFVAPYAPMLASLRGSIWEYRPMDAPVLAMVAVPRGVALGDAAGNVTLVRSSDGVDHVDHVEVVAFGQPVVDLCATSSALVALGAEGSIQVLRLADDGFDQTPAFVPLALGPEFDRPIGFFGTAAGRIGAFTINRIALLDLSALRPVVGQATVPGDIRRVIAVGKPPVFFGVLNDEGALFIADADMAAVRPVSLPGNAERVTGIDRGTPGMLAAWTDGGNLFLINRDRAARKVAWDGVVLARPTPASVNHLLCVHWLPGRGVRVQSLEPTT